MGVQDAEVLGIGMEPDLDTALSATYTGYKLRLPVSMSLSSLSVHL